MAETFFYTEISKFGHTDVLKYIVFVSLSSIINDISMFLKVKNTFFEIFIFLMTYFLIIPSLSAINNSPYWDLGLGFLIVVVKKKK